jgi:urease accessory protein
VAEPLALLAILRLADSALPVGGYTLSHGLETCAALDLIATPAALETLLVSYLHDVIGPTDAVACAASWAAVAAADLAGVVAIDRALYALKTAREARDGATRAGRRLLALSPAWGEPAPLDRYRVLARQGTAPACYAVVFGVAAQALGAPQEGAVVAYLHATLLGLLAAAQRLTPLDHEQAQGIVARLGNDIARLTSAALATDWRMMGSSAPEIDIASMRHERAYVRLFAS